LTIELAKNMVHHERSKYIDTHFHFIRDHVKKEEVKVMHATTHDQVVYIFTKPLSIFLFENLKDVIEMKDKKYFSLKEKFVKN